MLRGLLRCVQLYVVRAVDWLRLLGRHRMLTAAVTRAPTWIHLNAAGASPMSDAAHRTVVDFLELERDMGGYANAAHQPADPHNALARLLNCAASEIAMADSAQMAWAYICLQLT